MKNLPGAVQRSGGPKSTSGKARSSGNAMKFGVYSRIIFLPDEDPEEFEQLREALYADLLPQTVAENVLATEVLLCIWKKHRLERLETTALENIRLKPIEMVEWRLELGEKFDHTFKQAKRFDDRIAEKGIDHYKQLLTPLFEVKRRFPRNCLDLERFKREHSEVYRLMQTVYYWPRELDEKILKNELIDSGNVNAQKSFWEKLLNDTEAWILDRISVYESIAAIEAGIPKIIARRIYLHLKSEALDRATNSVTQALSRALSEYYKERDRRRRDTAILLPKETIADVQAVEATD